ncbi:hypothetical protein BDV98DRAFT_559783 [Pterulicium gracile]|uniref:Ser-Thr-rich glycosyl-phosphatidyl-inositol-anchored membrane family-domain-containing protein n=1 Tax=Pterulicium gracile TaxID=1884261 RepID=A0A5C3R0Q2_9AGAR|nr:hypothetical protein BDV98DRAFT_559783 [Pterula gracilis]
MRSGPLVLVHHRSVLLALTLSLLLSLLHAPFVWAQTVVNGQIHTNGLAIVNAPAMNSQLHAGSDLHLSVEVSANGKLSASSFLPGSSESTRYDSLEVYLVSSRNKVNLTISGNTTILELEGSSTVKHLNWKIPTCVTTGEYGLTLYEGSHVDGQARFAITAIPIQIQNSGQSGSCAGNSFQPNTQDPASASPGDDDDDEQERPASELPANPTLPSNPQRETGPVSSSTVSSTAVGSGGTPPVVGTSGTNTNTPNTEPTAPAQPENSPVPENPTVITIVVSGSGPLPFDFPTVTVTDLSPPATRTVIIESPVTLTSVIVGPTDTLTVTVTTLGQSTTTVVTGADGVFVPIGSSGMARYPLFSSWGTVFTATAFGFVSVLLR